MTTSTSGEGGEHAAAVLFDGPGEMRARCRAFKWGATPLGPVAAWPQSLRTAVNLCLGSAVPSYVWWGPALIQIYNDAALAIVRGKHPAALGAPAAEAWADVWPVVGPLAERVLATGESIRGDDLPMTPSRGSPTETPEPAWFTFSYGPARDERGAVVGVFCVALETTDRVRAEAALRESEAAMRARLVELEVARAAADLERRRLLAVLEHLPVGVHVAEAPSGRLVLDNAAIRAICGDSPRSEGVASYSVDYAGVYPAGHPRAGEPVPSEAWPLARALATGDSARNELVEMRRTDGTRRLVSVSAAPVRDADGRIVGGVATSTDVTEREQLLAAAEEARERATEAWRAAETANRAKTEFLSAMSHELRTPLNAILGYGDLLAAEIRGPLTAAQHEDVVRIRRAGQHLLALITDVLNYARLDAGRVRYDISDVLLDDIIVDVDAMIAPQVQGRGLTFTHDECESDTPEQPHRVRADAEKVRQILLNLLTNAVKFTPPGGRIALDCDTTTSDAVSAGAGDEHQTPMIRLRVTDTGTGIEPEHLADIFEPFVQLGRSRSQDSQQGVGLGLAISRDLARAMGGDITVESTPGAGSTFTLLLPRA